MRQKWLIRLGALEWQRFTHLQPTDGMELLGSVRRGAQMGALARLPDQRFVQVNGDHLSPLSQAQIRRALTQAQTAAAPRPRRHFSARPSGPPADYVTSTHAATPYTAEDGGPPPVRATPSTAPTVTIKRRRRVIMP